MNSVMYHHQRIPVEYHLIFPCSTRLFLFRMFEIEEHNSKYVSTAFHATHFASKDPVLGGVSVSDLPRNGKVS